MYHRRPTSIAVVIMLVTLLGVSMGLWVIVGRARVISPIPPDTGIRIILLSPAPSATISPSPSQSTKQRMNMEGPDS